MSRIFGCGLLSNSFRRLRKEIDDQISADRERAASRRVKRPPVGEPAAGHDRVDSAIERAGEHDPVAVPSATELALPDYDHLPASQIVALLGDLGVDELAEIAAYERANRGRRTVLGKVAQLGR
ncbi:MAG: hypothetical protein QNM02_06145 [Acidimicrobiia bacterium]|nr:hypothetical protein [Acidimicrobiia bacterium]